MNWVIIRRRCDCRGAALSVCGRINTQAPINPAWDDHWPRIRAGLFYWLKSERAFNIAPSPMTASYCPNPGITGSKGSSLANGHSKRCCIYLNTLLYFGSKSRSRSGKVLKSFLGGSLLEAMLGLVDGAIVRPIPTPCRRTVGGGRAG